MGVWWLICSDSVSCSGDAAHIRGLLHSEPDIKPPSKAIEDYKLPGFSISADFDGGSLSVRPKPRLCQHSDPASGSTSRPEARMHYVKVKLRLFEATCSLSCLKPARHGSGIAGRESLISQQYQDQPEARPFHEAREHVLPRVSSSAAHGPLSTKSVHAIAEMNGSITVWLLCTWPWLPNTMQ